MAYSTERRKKLDRERYLRNREIRKQYQREYYRKNRTAILKWHKDRVIQIILRTNGTDKE